MRNSQLINTTVRNGKTFIVNIISVYLYDDNIKISLKEWKWIQLSRNHRI